MLKTRLHFLVLLLGLQANAQTKRENTFPYATIDSVLTSISTQYEAGWMQRVFMGKNYRKTWSTPVKLPVFRLSQSALQIVGLGGGKQTKSLRLKDQMGTEWVLRTVNKDVSAGVSKLMQHTLVKNLMQDMISALYPYSQIITAQLAKASHIVAASPRIYFVAEDKALGDFHGFFANKVCVLEERAPTPDHSGVIETRKLLPKLKEKNDRLILQKQVLQARLLDMLIGDWDRHFDQWLWAVVDSANAEYYYTIPKDRDNAFFYSDGLVLTLFHKTIWPFYIGFTSQNTQLKKFNYKAWEFDRTFLNELDAVTWQQTIRQFLPLVNDSVLEASVKVLPQPVFALNGQQLVSKLKSRRDGLLKNALQYYQFLSATVTINGSDEEELFVISGQDQKLRVTIFKKNQPDQKIYERLFDPSETHMIQLNGLKGNDRFIVEASTPSSIKLKIFGNEGKDSFEINGKPKLKIIDTADKNTIVWNTALQNAVFAELNRPLHQKE